MKDSLLHSLTLRQLVNDTLLLAKRVGRFGTARISIVGGNAQLFAQFMRLPIVALACQTFLVQLRFSLKGLCAMRMAVLSNESYILQLVRLTGNLTFETVGASLLSSAFLLYSAQFLNQLQRAFFCLSEMLCLNIRTCCL